MSPIEESEYLPLNGVDQWFAIRGEDRDNPPLILLHGGPGLSETGFFRRYNRPLEQSFTVVYWDQRGAGRSFHPELSPSSMNVEQLIADLDGLVDEVCERLGKTKVALYGHSWGTALGVLYAARFPQKVSVYAGSGQIGDWPACERATYDFALAEAKRRGKKQAVEDLLRIGPPPHDAKRLWVQRLWLSRLEGRMSPRAIWDLMRTVSALELPDALRGFRFSLETMWPEVSALNLCKRVPELKMPVFLLLGRQDHWVDPSLSMAFFDGLEAPSKKVIWFEDSGHEPFVDEPARFNAVMAALVRPAARGEPAAPVPASAPRSAEAAAR